MVCILPSKMVLARERRTASICTSLVLSAFLLVAYEVTQMHYPESSSEFQHLIFPFADGYSNAGSSTESGAEGYSFDNEDRKLEGDNLGSYPKDLIIQKPYDKGVNKVLVWIHILLSGYAFLGLNTVCDIYFTGALEVMVEQWKIKPDVAGATFMAAGGSAPELFTSLIGAVITTNDVGFGTIVGSAVFNVLFVIGACGFAAKKPIKLSWWPLFRDCTFYVISLAVLAVFASSGDGYDEDGKKDDGDQDIAWWEALVLFLMYVIYCIIMYFNEKLEALTDVEFMRAKKEVDDSQPHPRRNQVAPETLGAGPRNAADAQEEASPGPPSHHIGITGDQAYSPELTPETTPETHHHPSNHRHQAGKVEAAMFLGTAAQDRHEERMRTVDPGDKEKDGEEKEEKEEGADEDDDDEDDDLLTMPEDTVEKIKWILALPIYVPLAYGIPMPSEKCFIVTFLLSLVWIAGFSFFLVWWITLAGEVYGIPITVMSFTLLAAGTSIPDMVSSVAVARMGEGDMAVSSSIGSNIFDILVGLPIPWMIKIGIVEGIANKNKDYRVGMDSPFLAFYVIILLFMVFMVVLSIHFLGWQLNKYLGGAMGLLYLVFLAVVLSVELTYEYTDNKLKWLQMNR